MVQFKSLYLVLKHFHHLKRLLLLLLLSRFSRVRLCATPKMAAHQAPRPWDSPGKNTGVGCHFLLQCMKVKMKSPSRVWLLATPWTAAYQAPPSMGFSTQEYWSGLPLPSPLKPYLSPNKDNIKVILPPTMIHVAYNWKYVNSFLREEAKSLCDVYFSWQSVTAFCHVKI